MSKGIREAGKWVSGQEFAARPPAQPAANTVAKQVGGQVAAGTAGHMAGKVAQKIGSKVVPGVGTGLSVYDAWNRWREGDRSGAVISALAAAGWLIPGPAGWAVGGGLDALNVYRDLSADDEETEPAPTEPPGRSISGPVTKAAASTSTSLSPFQQAFAAARRAGQSTFVYNGKSYNTNMAENTNQSQHPDIASNQRTTRILRQLRSANPEARNDLEALLYDYRKSQRQDRVDIARLDREIDIEDEEIAALQRALDQLRRSRGLAEAAALSEGRMKEIYMQYEDYRHLPQMAFLSRYKMTKSDWWNKYRRLIQGSGLGIGMDEAFKYPKKTAQEKMHQRHQELRKKSGLPDPQHYKDLGEKLRKEIEQLKREINNEALLAGSGSMAEDELDDRITAQYNTPQMKARGQEIDQAFAKNDSAKLRSMGIIPPDDIERDYQAMRAKEPAQDAALREFAPGDGSGNDRNITWQQLVNFIQRTLDSFGFNYEGSQGFAEYNRGNESLTLEYDPSDPGWFGWALGEYAGDFNVRYSGTDPLTIDSAENVLEYVRAEFGFGQKNIDEGGFDIPEIPRQPSPTPKPNKGMSEEAKKGLYYYVNKRKKAGTSRPKGHPKAPSAQDWKDAAKTAKTEDVTEANHIRKFNDYDQWLNYVDKLGADKFMQKNRTLIIAQSWDGEKAGEFDLKDQHGWLMMQDVAEAGPFSYGAKKPHKGSVADLAAKKRQQQERGKQPAEPRDHMVGVARVKKDVEEAKTRLDPKCWTGYKKQGTKMKGGVRVNNCVPKE